jgi:hypothetical protein
MGIKTPKYFKALSIIGIAYIFISQWIGNI